MADTAVTALREGLWLVLLVCGPPLGAALGVGLVMALAQSAFRIEERTISVVPRIAAALIALAVAGPWIGAQVVRFTAAVLAALPAVGRT